MTTVAVGGVIAAAVSGAVGPVALALLRRGDVLDHPSERSSHAVPVPRGGGVGPAIGALVALAVTPSLPTSGRWAVVVAATGFGVVGLTEDLVGIRALLRLAIQFGAAVLAAPLLLHSLTGPTVWRGAVVVVTIVWLVAYVNAYNFMDGIDGISVAQAVGAGVTWFLVGRHVDSRILAVGGIVVAGAALGFAPFNVPRARMFLGDVGSYFIGAWLAAVAVLGLRAGVPAEAVLAPLVLYVADTGTTLLRRVVRGERWYLPHRDHAYQRLGDAGWSHMQAAGLVAGCIAACGALGAVSLTGSTTARVVADAAVAGVIGAYLLAPRWLRRNAGSAVVAG
ncbi:MAG TPA: glycosyltransferase family 4 protein [Acidimicrobiales bacterium]|jgi:UDP-N-acetylmuramyl pentapeptide phosphotransferase/UDP-N-acetylglucosamine-1-phosphate transferase|nr:glycosyltransferase family 4 protein [Acidimicrobiales bacterium]